KVTAKLLLLVEELSDKRPDNKDIINIRWIVFFVTVNTTIWN
ncbi:23050_t:CDS:1, partial [Dentiscutata erythropus]